VDGERKTVTALFADIKGSTELMRDLDPEEARAIVDPVLHLMMAAVHRYGGYVAQSTGDGIFAIFGAPIAHEDHPQRALHAALAMQEELRRYAERLRADGKIPVEARVGVNTGEVVVRTIETGGHTEYTPVGHVTNLAARMQTAAPAGSIAASEATQRLCEGYFEFRALGPTAVKGLNAPVAVYEVVRVGPLRTHFQLSTWRGLTRFVGREREMGAMAGALEQVRAGHGQIVAAVGEAGAGKSRLFYEFRAISQSGCLVLEAFSASHGRASAYFPIIDLLRAYFRIGSGDDERTRREKVNGKVLTLDHGLEDTLPYLFALLGIVEGDDRLAQMDAQIRKRRTLDAIKRILLRESLNQPLMVIFEDLHWIDDETQAVLNLLADSIGTARVLLPVNYRPEYSHSWGGKTYYTQLRLDPLGKESADEMLSALLGDDKDLILLKRLIIERTEGNPFFIEEMVQVLFDDGALLRKEPRAGARAPLIKLTKSLHELEIPPTVQAILAARIDRLPGAEKELLQRLAVLGKVFPLRLIQRVVDPSVRASVGARNDDLSGMLAKLQIAEFIYEQPAVDDVEYTFKHALTREVAYSTLLIERRRLLHERAGRAVEALYADSLDDHLADLGHHFERAGNAMEAAKYLGRAGILAAAKSTFSEAISHLSAGLDLVHTLPESSERARTEWDLLTELTACLNVTAGAGSSKRGEALMRMRELCDQLGDDARLFQVVSDSINFHSVRNELAKERELSEQAVTIAERSNSAAFLKNACNCLGYSLWKLGEFSAAREQLERAIAAPRAAHPRAGVAPGHYKMLAVANLAWVQWILGFPVQAAKTSQDALNLARNDLPPVSLTFGLIYSAELHRFVRDADKTGVLSCEALEIATQSGFSLLEAQAKFEHGWSLIQGTQVAAGLAEMNRAMEALEATGAVASAWCAAPLAEAWAKRGSPEKGLEPLRSALRAVSKTGERFYEAELRRLVGELTLSIDSSKVAEARQAFDEAIIVARAQNARSLELRATTSLARLFEKNDERAKARARLSSIYGWFTEGFETPDLTEARSLLDELSA
jgi:predicted ATPase/class 3 adenylate cyclase